MPVDKQKIREQAKQEERDNRLDAFKKEMDSFLK